MEFDKGIYSENIDDQLSRYRDALQSFIDYYGDQDVMILSVPGKCEIGGNHTDHQHGRVLASAIQLDSICIVAKQERYAKVIYNEYLTRKKDDWWIYYYSRSTYYRLRKKAINIFLEWWYA